MAEFDRMRFMNCKMADVVLLILAEIDESHKSNSRRRSERRPYVRKRRTV
jgi:hypothetical protein